MARREAVYWAGRATLVRRPEDIDGYDRVFQAFWLGVLAGLSPPPEQQEVILAVDSGEDSTGAEEPDDDTGEPVPTLTVRYSRTEVLRHKDFAAYTHAEFAEARRLMADLRLAGELRRSRRLRPARRASGRPNLRGTVRQAIRAGGEPIERAWLVAAERPRRVVLLCDVSGSMEPYARALLRFLHAAVTAPGPGRVEAFAIGTRLTRITRELGWRDPDAALADAARAVADWSGGPRLGCGPSTTGGGCAAWPEAPLSSSSPTAGTAATRPSWPLRWAGCTGWPIVSCGSTRSKRPPDTPRWPVGWPRPSRTLTTSWRVIHWPPSSGWWR
jgi:uncharacterized protein with von Willebrand factor type A (vWA) domain